MSAYKVLHLTGGSRELEPYLGFIVTNWLSTMRWTNDWFKLIDKTVYYSTYKQVLRTLLAKPSIQVALAVLADDSDVCLGCSVHEGSTLHYCFVRRAGRKQGIARSLIPKQIDVITHLTLTGVVIWKNKISHAIFNPFAL